MDLLEWFVFLSTLIGALNTGSFLTLDVATKTLQNKWGFDSDEMVSVGTVGYSLGFLGVALSSLYLNKFGPKVFIILGGSLTSLCWLGIYLTLCKGCIEWHYAMLFEAGIGCGTALSYLSSASIITKSSFGDGRKMKLIFLALFVAIGSIIAFIIFVDLNNVKLTILIMLIYNSVSTILLFISSFIYKEEQVISLPLYGQQLEEQKNFSASFGMYLFALNLTFGVVMTFINSANGILDSFEKKWDNPNNKSQFPLICFVIGNFIGRFSGIFLRSYLKYMLHLFSGFSIILAILQSILLINWNIRIVFAMLGISAIFFGIIWAITMPMAREFFNIREDRSLGLVFFGMALLPMVFGMLASWLYRYRKSYLGDTCDYTCFWTYLSLSTMATILSVFSYICAWYLRRNEKFMRLEIL